MKVFSVLIMALICVATFGGCRKDHDGNGVVSLMLPVISVYTPLGLNVVEILDLDGSIANGFVTVEQLLADLDYVVLTWWLTSVQYNPNYSQFTVEQLTAYAYQVRFVW